LAFFLNVHVSTFAHGDASAMDPTVGEEDSLLPRAEFLWCGRGDGNHFALDVAKYGIDAQRAIDPNHN
jgi:hypothetical protein